MIERKIGLFGGTFDPVHLGHTAVARTAAEHIGAESIVFIPAKRSPLKGFAPAASNKDRLRMVELAIAGNKKFQLSDYELNKTGPCYTLDTVKKFQQEYGRQTSIYWLVGADSVNDFVHWYKIAELIDCCNLSVMYRAGYRRPDFSGFASALGEKRIRKLQRSVIATDVLNISSTEIRKKLGCGESVKKMVCPAVTDYIRQHGLYQKKSPGT